MWLHCLSRFHCASPRPFSSLCSYHHASGGWRQPLAFSFLHGVRKSLSLPSRVILTSPLSHLLDSLWLVSTFFVSGDKNGTSYFRYALMSAEQRGIITSLNLLTTLFWHAVRIRLDDFTVSNSAGPPGSMNFANLLPDSPAKVNKALKPLCAFLVKTIDLLFFMCFIILWLKMEKPQTAHYSHQKYFPTHYSLERNFLYFTCSFCHINSAEKLKIILLQNK